MGHWFSHTPQLDARDCGPACLHMNSRHHGRQHNLALLSEYCHITREGVSLLGISDAAEKIGFRTMGVKISYEKLANEVPLPCIAHWKQRHFVVVYGIGGKHKDKVKVADPAHGLLTYSRAEFEKAWASTSEQGEPMGVCLLLEPTPDFYAAPEELAPKNSFRYLFAYLKPHHKLLMQLMLGMLLGSLLQLIFPFLTQSVVDVGINTRDLNFITLVLIAQLVLFFSQTAIEFIRSWILLHISTRINISLISDFLIKLMKLPIGFFDSKIAKTLPELRVQFIVI
jgi:ATP-binding cassette subfamily B protein